MRFNACLIGVSAALLLSTGDVLAANRALVVGVDHYPGISRNGVAGAVDLRGSVHDARNFAKLLEDALGFGAESVKLLTNADATRSAILDDFQTWMIDGTKPGDRAVFYYSGHGAQVMVPDGQGGKRMTSAIVPADATGDIHSSMIVDGLILGPQIGELIRKLSGREIVVVADSCYSGSISRGLGAGSSGGDVVVKTITPVMPLNLSPSELTAKIVAENKTKVRLFEFTAKGDDMALASVAVWSATTLAQLAFDTPDGGVFTTSFIAGLRDRKADLSEDGKVTVSEQLAYVREASKEFCAAHNHGCRYGLTPELQSADSYRASVIVPYEPTPPPQPSLPPEPSAPALVGLADGVLNHQNDFNLLATILPGTVIKHGEAVQFRIEAGEEGQLVVLDTGPDGKLRRIYPNEYSEAAGRRGLIRAGSPLTIPDESYPLTFKATDDGPGTLLVLVAEKGIDLGPLLGNPAFEPTTNADRSLIAVAANLQAPITNLDPNTPNRAGRWAFVTVPYVVRPKAVGTWEQH